MYEVIIQSKEGIQEVSNLVIGDITLEDNYNKSSILKLGIAKGPGLKGFYEGNSILFKKDGVTWFVGFIFKKQRKKDGIIQVTCYDQMRYLKNEDEYNFIDKTATEILNAMAKDFGIKLGNVASTGYQMKFTSNGQSVLDILMKAIDLTTAHTGSKFILKDVQGSLCLMNVKELVKSVVLNEDIIEDFNYESSIDESTYNQVKLVKENKDAGKREIYLVNDSGNIAKWGLLQYFEKVDENSTPEQIKQKADMLLALHNKVKRTLKVTCQGHNDFRSGHTLLVDMKKLGDLILKEFLFVETVKHTFKYNNHRCDVTLKML